MLLQWSFWSQLSILWKDGAGSDDVLSDILVKERFDCELQGGIARARKTYVQHLKLAQMSGAASRDEASGSGHFQPSTPS